MIKTVLIANRGEIACRIIKSCRRLNIKSVAVFSDADKEALHVKLADRAVHIGPAEARDSYLNIDAILNACQASGADALHPGYGFLSENAEFAKALGKAKVTFIGPSAEVISAMGDKLQAKALAAAANVPLVPGIECAVKSGKVSKETIKDVENFALKVGLPLIVKAAGGGGGRGMRVVSELSHIEEALQSASREALAFFKDERVFIEKCVENARHIEVQIFGDSSGKVVAIGDRDCSMQRKHQKVIEEAPAPNIPPDVRAEIHNSAVRLGEKAGYVGAGTVEFLYDGRDKFYFLEVNSRLQVEHPVTEETGGIDLVELQIRIAAGDKLENLLKGWDSRPKGHAIECRLTAECPEDGFTASTGKIATLLFPVSPQLRVDSGFRSGDTISHYYDSLVAKLIVRGRNREDAIQVMNFALTNLLFSGLASNVNYLLRLLNSPAFNTVSHHTRIAETLLPSAADRELEDCSLAALATIGPLLPKIKNSKEPWDKLPGWRTHSQAFNKIDFKVGGRIVALSFQFRNGNLQVVTNAGTVAIADLKIGERGMIEGLINGFRIAVGFSAHEGALWSLGSFGNFKLEHFQPRLKAPAIGEQDHSGDIVAPFPGKIVGIKANVGSIVEQGEPVIVIESMKMEHQLRAPLGGKIKGISVKPGDIVESARVLAEIDCA